MSGITRKDIEHIAKLARIDLRDDELEKFRANLNKVLGYIEVLKEVKTDGVEPLAQVTGLKNVFREDEAEEPKNADAILGIAPETEGRFIKVKKVF